MRSEPLAPGPALTRRRTIAAALLLTACASTGVSFGWGLVAHRIVTEAAAARMPPDVAAFFASGATALSDASLEPDTVLRPRDASEAARHFINLDALAAYPFDTIPREYEEARALLGEAIVRKNGVLPWRVAQVLKSLTAAMRKRDRAAILSEAGHLAHYVADVFQPLHLTKNYDGQASCNEGIHDAFESELVERSSARFRSEVARGRASVTVVDRPVRQVFEWMRQTYPLVEDLLKADTASMKALKTERRDYFETLDRLAGPMAERQLSAAANAVASLWYTAWVEAGRPALAGR